MNIKMTIAQRTTTRLALGLHLKLVGAAIKATEKALVSPLPLTAAQALIDASFASLPSSHATNELWDATDSVRLEYRDALFILGSEVSKVRTKEIERGIDTASSDERLEEIRTLLRELGDQRDLFAAVDEAIESVSGDLTDDEQSDLTDADRKETVSFNDGPKIPAKTFKQRVERMTKK